MQQQDIEPRFRKNKSGHGMQSDDDDDDEMEVWGN